MFTLLFLYSCFSSKQNCLFVQQFKLHSFAYLKLTGRIKENESGCLYFCRLSLFLHLFIKVSLYLQVYFTVLHYSHIFIKILVVWFLYESCHQSIKLGEKVNTFLVNKNTEADCLFEWLWIIFVHFSFQTVSLGPVIAAASLLFPRSWSGTGLQLQDKDELLY